MQIWGDQDIMWARYLDAPISIPFKSRGGETRPGFGIFIRYGDWPGGEILSAFFGIIQVAAVIK